MSLFSGLARFLSKQENGKRAARGDDIPGHGECPRARDVHLLFFKAIDAVRLVSSLERSRGQQGNKNKWSVTEEGRGEGVRELFGVDRVLVLQNGKVLQICRTTV